MSTLDATLCMKFSLSLLETDMSKKLACVKLVKHTGEASSLSCLCLWLRYTWGQRHKDRRNTDRYERTKTHPLATVCLETQKQD